MFTFTRLYSDASGESHFDDVEVRFAPVDRVAGAPPLNLSDITNCADVRFMEAPAAWSSDWAAKSISRISRMRERALLICSRRLAASSTATGATSGLGGWAYDWLPAYPHLTLRNPASTPISRDFSLYVADQPRF